MLNIFKLMSREIDKEVNPIITIRDDEDEYKGHPLSSLKSDLEHVFSEQYRNITTQCISEHRDGSTVKESFKALRLLSNMIEEVDEIINRGVHA